MTKDNTINKFQQPPDQGGIGKPDLKVIEKTFEVDEGLDPLIPEGVYICKLMEWRTVKFPMFGNAQKLMLVFSIAEFGHELFGTQVRAFYNVKIKGKAITWGNFKAPRRGNFMLDFCTCFPNVQIKRTDRLPMSLLTKNLIKVKVMTVTQTRLQEKLPKALQYSVVKKLEGIHET